MKPRHQMNHDDCKQGPVNRHKGVLTSLCGCQADDTNGFCDKQWSGIPARALSGSETLATSDKFASENNGCNDVI